MGEWWEVFELPQINDFWGIVTLATVIVIVLIGASLAVAYAWHRWRG